MEQDRTSPGSGVGARAGAPDGDEPAGGSGAAELAALRDSEARFRSLTLLSSHWYWEQDAQFRFTSFKGAQQSATWRPDERLLVGHARWEIAWLHPVDTSWDEHRALLAAHQPFRDFVFLNDRFPDKPVYLCSTGEPVFAADGTFRGYRGTTRDVTAQRAAEERLRGTESLLRMSARIGRLGAWAYRAGDERVTWSDELCDMHEAARGFAPTPDEVIALFAAEHQELIRTTFEACLCHGAAFDVEAISLTRTGRVRWLRVIGEAERDGQGRVVRIQGACQDITESKRAAEESRRLAEQLTTTLRRLNAELEARVKERTAQLERTNGEFQAFSYAIAHDLRAPLAAIDGFSECLEREAAPQLSGRPAHYLERIRVGVRHMRELTSGLLSLASLSQAALRHKPVDLAELARHAIAGCRDGAPQREVDVHVADSLPAHGDPRLLAQAIENLVGNAWKFTGRREQARIDVGSVRAADGRVTYFIRDNGAGFDAAYSAKLFEPFQRLHTQDEFEGTGIGLAIVRKVIALHGGRIWAEGAPGQGATFYFTLA